MPDRAPIKPTTLGKSTITNRAYLLLSIVSPPEATRIKPASVVMSPAGFRIG